MTAQARLPFRPDFRDLVGRLLAALDEVASWSRCEECGGEGEHEEDCALLALIAEAREVSRGVE